MENANLSVLRWHWSGSESRDLIQCPGKTTSSHCHGHSESIPCHPVPNQFHLHPIPSDVGFVWSVVIKIVSITLCWFWAFIQADCRLPPASWISALWQLNFHFFFFCCLSPFLLLLASIAISTSVYLGKKQFLFLHIAQKSWICCPADSGGSRKRPLVKQYNYFFKLFIFCDWMGNIKKNSGLSCFSIMELII